MIVIVVHKAHRTSRNMLPFACGFAVRDALVPARRDAKPQADDEVNRLFKRALLTKRK
jgi:hypothetical protein